MEKGIDPREFAPVSSIGRIGEFRAENPLKIQHNPRENADSPAAKSVSNSPQMLKSGSGNRMNNLARFEWRWPRESNRFGRIRRDCHEEKNYFRVARENVPRKSAEEKSNSLRLSGFPSRMCLDMLQTNFISPWIRWIGFARVSLAVFLVFADFLGEGRRDKFRFFVNSKDLREILLPRGALM